jgi:hypothetical protein
MVYKQEWSIKNYRYVWDVLGIALSFSSIFRQVAWGLLARFRIKVEVLRFLSCEVVDQPDASAHWSGLNGVFRKASPASSTGHIISGDCWFRRDSVVCTHVFLWPFGFIGSASKLHWLLISWSMSSFHCADGECHGYWDLRTSNDGLSLVDKWELAWWFVTWSSDMQLGATTHERFMSYLSGWKSKVWP